jgi:hypothetical protein
MQALVRASEYVMTLHGHEEMEADGLTVYDVEHVILNGRIVERQSSGPPDDTKLPPDFRKAGCSQGAETV